MKLQYLLTFALCLAATDTMQAASAAKAEKAPAKEESTTKKAGKITYEGGDGSTMEKAIIIKGAKSSEDGVPAEYAYLKKKYKNHEVISQGLMSKDGKSYDLINIKTAKGETIGIYFDITDFFGKL